MGSRIFTTVIPAKAGIHLLTSLSGHKLRRWTPAYAGVTKRVCGGERFLENLPNLVLRAAEADAFLGFDERALDQDRVLGHRVEDLVVADGVLE